MNSRSVLLLSYRTGFCVYLLIPCTVIHRAMNNDVRVFCWSRLLYIVFTCFAQIVPHFFLSLSFSLVISRTCTKIHLSLTSNTAESTISGEWVNEQMSGHGQNRMNRIKIQINHQPQKKCSSLSTFSSSMYDAYTSFCHSYYFKSIRFYFIHSI